MIHNEDITRGNFSVEDAEAVRRSMVSTIETLKNDAERSFSEAESTLMFTEAVKKVSFMKEDIVCQADPIIHDYDNLDDYSRKAILQSYADRLMKANTELAMSNQRCAFTDHRLAASEAGQKRSREIIRTLRSKVKDMLEVAFEQERDRIACVRQLSERLSVANDDRQKIIKQRDLFSEQLKEERRKNQLLEEENSKLKRNFADVEAKKEIIEEKMEQMKDELAALKKKSDEINGDLKKLRKERDDLKQENSRISREQKKLTTEYENKFEEMKKEYCERLVESSEKDQLTIKELGAKATATIDRLTAERDHYYKEYTNLLADFNEKKEIFSKQVKQQLTTNYIKTMKGLQENNRDVRSNREEVRSLGAPVYHDEIHRLNQAFYSTSESSENHFSAEPPISTNRRRSMSRNPPEIPSKFSRR
uniref:Uncharacterized protein n=1 Tax=Panagrolaimus sp. JU765 TaxID=591449 RepID=A0AC34QG80_9BILA